MRWRNKDARILGRDGATRIKKRFAFWPTQMDSGDILWLECFVIEEKFLAYRNHNEQVVHSWSERMRCPLSEYNLIRNKPSKEDQLFLKAAEEEVEEFLRKVVEG